MSVFKSDKAPNGQELIFAFVSTIGGRETVIVFAMGIWKFGYFNARMWRNARNSQVGKFSEWDFIDSGRLIFPLVDFADLQNLGHGIS